MNVYYRVNAPFYQYPFNTYTDEECEAFYTEAIKALESIGFSMQQSYAVREKEKLHLHPQNISGEVLKNHVKEIAEALSERQTFTIRWVDLYETRYDLTNEEYEPLLESKDTSIKAAILNSCKTKRWNQYYRIADVSTKLAKQFRIPRVGKREEEQTAVHIRGLIKGLIEAGYLIMVTEDGIRTVNKTEQKKRKLDMQAFSSCD